MKSIGADSPPSARKITVPAGAKQLRGALASSRLPSCFDHQIDALAFRQSEYGVNGVFLAGVYDVGRAQLLGHCKPVRQGFRYHNQFRADQPGKLDRKKSLRAGAKHGHATQDAGTDSAQRHVPRSPVFQSGQPA